MRRRTPSRPAPVVEVKPKRKVAAPGALVAPRSLAAPRRATPDRGRIRGYNPDDREAREREAFERKPTPEQMAEAESWWQARFQRPNDPEVAQRIARQGVGRDLTEASMSHMQIIEDPRDPRVVLRPNRGLWSRLRG
jgi:hypothetical protein